MLTTGNYGLKKPEGTDPVDVQDFNENADIIDAELKKRPTATGNASDMTNTFVQAEMRADLVSGEALKTSLGKVMKWFSDLKTAAFAEVANNDSTAAEGYVADARVVKAHGDEIDMLQNALTAHKASGDHDGRYYTSGQVNNLLAGKIATTASCNKNWNWSGQPGQPKWLWGGTNGTDMYVWDPVNFSVAKAAALSQVPNYSFHSGGTSVENDTSTTVLTCKAPDNGYFLVNGQAVFASNSKGYRIVDFRNVDLSGSFGTAKHGASQSSTTVLQWTSNGIAAIGKGGIINVVVRQNSGGPLKVSGIWVSLIRIGTF